MTEEHEDALDQETSEDEVSDDPIKEIQKLKSHLGRQEKANQEFQAKVLEAMKDMRQDSGNGPTKLTIPNDGNDPEIDKFNEHIQELKDAGKHFEAHQAMESLKSQADSMRNQVKIKHLDTALEKYKDRPYMKEIGEYVQKAAVELMAEGYLPKHAVRAAYAEISSKHQFNELAKLRGNTGSLSMLSGGNQRMPEKKAGKLPPNYEAACKRDIAKGYFKDQKEYIESLAPSLRAQLGV